MFYVVLSFGDARKAIFLSFYSRMHDFFFCLTFFSGDFLLICLTKS